VATNFCQKWNSQARSGLPLLQIFADTSVPPSLALSINMDTCMHLVIGEVKSEPIQKGELIAFDWTFAPVANYILAGSKAMFTGMIGSSREWMCGKIVESTGADQVSHLLIESKQKTEENDPFVLYTDTCPHNTPFYKRIYGANLVMRLSLFHLMHRIGDTLDAHSMVYWKVLVKLKACFYTHREADLGALVRCLMDSTLYREGMKLPCTQIGKIQHSKK
jgi:hypothetical protein